MTVAQVVRTSSSFSTFSPSNDLQHCWGGHGPSLHHIITQAPGAIVTAAVVKLEAMPHHMAIITAACEKSDLPRCIITLQEMKRQELCSGAIKVRDMVVVVVVVV